MAFSDYTTPDSVRSVLGISAKEISDAKIADTVYLTTMLEALYALAPTLSADFTTARSANPRTAHQTRFVLLVETFCSYTVAHALIPNLPMAAPQIITDGKTAINRVANPYEHLREPLQASLAYFKVNLMAAYSDVNPAILKQDKLKRTLVRAAAMPFDPVTGA